MMGMPGKEGCQGMCRLYERMRRPDGLISEADQVYANLSPDYDRFIDRYGNDPDTWDWLGRHVPPLDFDGTQLQWAYIEMPIGLFTRRAGRFW